MISESVASVSTPFIRRPVATSLIAVALLISGLLGYFWLPVSSLPQVDFPTVQVTTRLPGANPDTVASLITAPLERQLGQIPSLQSMSSTSSFGISQISLQFDLARDIDGATQDVQAAIIAANATLPRNLPYPPTYAKVNPADAPIITLALTSKTVSLREMSDLADTLIAQQLSQISGVGRVTVQGGLKPAVRVQVDFARLAAYNIGLDDVRAVIAAANVAGPKGALDGLHQAYTIAANDQITAAEQYRNIVVAYRNSAPVMLTDVARIVDGLENDRVASSFNGEPAVVLDIQRQPGANVIETVRLIQAELPRLQGAIPRGVALQVVNDRTPTIRASVRDVQFTLVVSVALVVMVVLVFLRSAGATMIAGISLPLSLIMAFGVMYLAGFSLDNLSLMALTVGAGFVVDDVIVMVENIVRHIEEGDSAFNAALKGAGEIGFTVISLTLSLIAVFIPLLFMGGLVGRMFREFALTLTIAVLTSAVVSLTLTPMLASKLLGRAKEAGAGNRWMARATAAIDWIAEGYHISLLWVLRHRGATLLVTAATLALTVLLYVEMPKGFLPLQDTSLIIATTDASPDVSFTEMQRVQDLAAKAVQADPDVSGVVSLVGSSTVNLTPNSGRLVISLKPLSERRLRMDAVVARLKGEVARIPGIVVSFQPVQDVQIGAQVSRGQYQYTLTGTSDAEVAQWAGKLVAALRAKPLFREVSAETQAGGLSTAVTVDREQAGRFGVSLQNVNDLLNNAFGQRQISTIYGQANQYRVVLEAMPEYQTDPTALDKLYINGAGGTQVPLGAIVTVTRGTTPLMVAHRAQFPSATISFDLAPNAALGQAVDEVQRTQQEIGMPSAVVGVFTGDAAEFSRALSGQMWLILAAIASIYIVLGVLYESFVHPLTILSTLPSAGIGALLALLAFGQDLSVIGLIGVILLMGIVKKNAIMMIDFALSAERGEGLPAEEAILRACLLRFRPIMMTTVAALLGALPLALESGTGSELRFPLGIAIIGGLLLSQALTLYTTPVIYLALDRFARREGRPREDEEAEGAARPVPP